MSAKRLAVGEHHLYNTPNRLAILDRLNRDRGLIAGLESLLAPTKVGHVGRITGFSDPMDYGTFVILRIELQEAVWIGPEPFCDGYLHGEFLVGVEIRSAVMCRQRSHENATTQGRKESDKRSILHARPPIRTYALGDPNSVGLRGGIVEHFAGTKMH
jgi:hypothetical protein